MKQSLVVMLKGRHLKRRVFASSLLISMMALMVSPSNASSGPEVTLSISERLDNGQLVLATYSGFIPDGGLTDPYGIVSVWIRSTTLSGEMPDWLPHGAHFHDRSSKCPLNRNGSVGVAYPRKIGAYNFRNLTASCRETEKIWLNSFYSCREKCQSKK